MVPQAPNRMYRSGLAYVYQQGTRRYAGVNKGEAKLRCWCDLQVLLLGATTARLGGLGLPTKHSVRCPG